MRSISARLFAGVLVMGALPIAANAATTTFGPSAYLQHGDTPDGFACEQCTLVIEDFEDNSLHPFLSMSNGQILPPNSRSGIADFVTDSVDGDDGSVDGNGNGGYSWFSSNVRTVTISFANTVKSAGLVFTDGDYNATNVMLEAFNSSGASIGFLSAGDLADVTYTGETAEDTFLGFQSADGDIASIMLSMDAGLGIEIDHIHWQDSASCVPEPNSFGLLSLAFFVLSAFRRKRLG